MSTYYKLDEVEVNKELKEVACYITNDDWGAVYFLINFDQIEALYEEIKIHD